MRVEANIKTRENGPRTRKKSCAHARNENDADQLQTQELKKRKLALHDCIAILEHQLTPVIIAQRRTKQSPLKTLQLRQVILNDMVSCQTFVAAPSMQSLPAASGRSNRNIATA